jgi:LmbE family N-acetylglucosaminyl deacetylase
MSRKGAACGMLAIQGSGYLLRWVRVGIIVWELGRERAREAAAAAAVLGGRQDWCW